MADIKEMKDPILEMDITKPIPHNLSMDFASPNELRTQHSLRIGDTIKYKAPEPSHKMVRANIDPWQRAELERMGINPDRYLFRVPND